MAEPIANGSPYGQFGRANYDSEEKKWLFERTASHQHTLRILGKPRILVQPSLRQYASERPLGGKEGPSRRREKQAGALVQYIPELQPAIGLLPEFARVSEAIENAVADHDPSRGNLLAFGQIPDSLTKAAAHVLAFPSGPTGNDLRILQIQNQSLGWEDTRKAWLSVPTVSGEEASWNGPGVPIQSIDFTQSTYHGGAYLVVRLLTETLVFHPALQKSSAESSTRLKLNLLYRIPLDESSAASHAHLSINPLQSKQFAVVDQAGSWSIGKLETFKGNHSQDYLNSDLFAELDDNMQLQPMYDDWARIAWVGKPGNIVICNRKRLFLCNIIDTTLTEFPRITTHLQSGLGWNLDLIAVPFHENHVVLLTSDHIIVFFVERKLPEGLVPRIVSCSRHYRNPEDSSMRMFMVQDGDDLLLFVRSNAQNLVLLYRIHFSESEEITITDPTEFLLPTSESRIVDVEVHPLSITLRWNLHSTTSHASGYQARSIQFYAITTIHRDLSIQQSIYYSEPVGRNFRVLPLSWEGRIPPKSTTVVSAQSVKAEDDFVVEDDMSSTGEDASGGRTEPVSEFVQQHQAHMTSWLRQGWTMNYELITQRLHDVDSIKRTEAHEAIKSAQEILQTNEHGDATPFRTLRELADGEIDFNEAHTITAALEDLSVAEPASQLLDEIDDGEPIAAEPTRLISRPLNIAESLGLPSLDDLSALQHLIIEHWISPLPGDFPQPVRTAREQLAQQVAAELILANHILRPEPPPPPNLTDHRKDSQTQSQSQQSNPSGRSPATPTTSSVYFSAASSALHSPTPGPSSAPPSTTTTSSHPTTFSGPEIRRLSKYTTLTNPPPALPRSLSKVLSHWQPGTDPATYDWNSTTRQFAREAEEAETAQLPEKERRRLQRRTERYIRRQRREVEESRRQQVLSSQAPEVLSASQPSQDVRGDAGPSGGVAAIVAAQSSQIAASQILAGRHGGRKGVKKKRKLGF